MRAALGGRGGAGEPPLVALAPSPRLDRGAGTAELAALSGVVGCLRPCGGAAGGGLADPGMPWECGATGHGGCRRLCLGAGGGVARPRPPLLDWAGEFRPPRRPGPGRGCRPGRRRSGGGAAGAGGLVPVALAALQRLPSGLAGPDGPGGAGFPSARPGGHGRRDRRAESGAQWGAAGWIASGLPPGAGGQQSGLGLPAAAAIPFCGGGTARLRRAPVGAPARHPHPPEIRSCPATAPAGAAGPGPAAQCPWSLGKAGTEPPAARGCPGARAAPAGGRGGGGAQRRLSAAGSGASQQPAPLCRGGARSGGLGRQASPGALRRVGSPGASLELERSLRRGGTPARPAESPPEPAGGSDRRCHLLRDRRWHRPSPGQPRGGGLVAGQRQP